MPGKYKVGYKKPPARSRFKKGRSGNPRGRPKKTPTLGTEIAEALREKVTVTENGRRMRISRRELIVKQLLNKASTGDLPSIQLLLRLHRDGTLAENNGNTGRPTTPEDERAEILRLLEPYRPPGEREESDEPEEPDVLKE
jgi:uncharacterized protein DUF5681